MIFDDVWFEIWYEDGTEVIPSYLLIVTPDKKNPGQVLICDPQKRGEVVYRASNYEDAMYWLTEDEFSLTRGRMFPDDGWP